MWSSVPIRSQEGIVFQAGLPDFSTSALEAIGRCVAARTAASALGRSLARAPGKTSGFRYQSETPFGARYLHCLQAYPDVVLAHRDATAALASASSAEAAAL